MMVKDYIECAGVRVPTDWTFDDLAEALKKRNARFSNERDIKAAFQSFLDCRISLQNQIYELTRKRDSILKSMNELERDTPPRIILVDKTTTAKRDATINVEQVKGNK